MVILEPGALAKLCDIEGAMTMWVTNQCITFDNPRTRKNKYVFEMQWMRRYGKKGKDRFYFECGRRCPNGEGTVTCITTSASKIHRLIKRILGK
ncbi:hypothetical protein DPMN_012907 [Dreissena polymorpha]|uniref:IRS-type PTB domain-containing protein n=1 Tax=Dreissena polymorpha TaxID=45954 RepID=A0A9D4N6W2_DREPO|nr:hypothetical protein DPMN_012907 [Dreissena polymorpha]